MILRISFCLPVCLAVLSAQTSLSLSEAIRQAQTNHPSLLAARERVRASEAQRTQAALRPNPMLVLQSENARFWGSPNFSFRRDPEDFAYLTQVFETAGKRSRRTELALAEIRSAEIERAALARNIAARVSLAYWNAAAAAGLRDLLQENVETFDQVVQYHRDRVREGAMAEVDLMRVLLEQDRLAVAARSAEQDARQAIINLLRESGQTRFPEVILTDSLTEVRDLPLPEVAEVLAARPEVQAARQSIQQARASLRLQQAQAKPDPQVIFGYKRVGGLPTLVGGVQVDLPFFNRNQGNIAAETARIRGAEQQLAVVEVTVRAEVESAWSSYQARREILTANLQPMRERAEEIARIAFSAYQEGGVDLLRLLDAQRARLDALTLYFRALSDYQQSVTTLQIVTGAPL